MKDIIEKHGLENLLRPPRVGGIVEGTVVGGQRSTLYVDLGTFGTGVVLGKEFHNARSIIKNLKPGEKLLAKVVEVENEDGYIELSLQAADKEITWKKLKELKDKKEPLMVKIVGANKGGLLAEVSRIPAFLPASQLNAEHYPRVEDADQQKILRELQKFIGQELEVNILDLNRGEEKLILSEKIKEGEKIRKLLENYKVGDVIDGEVTGVVDFGAFIKFPASPTDGDEELEGLIHISELDWQLIENPEDIVKVGEKIKAKIIKIDGERVFLSLKALKKDPWEGIEENRRVGDKVTGKIVKLTSFGVFVEIQPSIQGLCHISEFGTKDKMEETLKIGESYEFVILQLEPKDHKMALKLSV